MMPISIVIPTFCRPESLAECLQSVLSDADRSPAVSVEIIVVDDGGCPPARVDRGIQLIRQSNQGAAAARNRGVERSTGEVIVFLDDDSVVPIGWLEHGVTWLQSRPHLDGMAGAVINRPNSGPGATINQAIIDGFRFQSFVDNKTAPFSTTNNLWIRRAAMSRGLLFDERFFAAGGEDRAYLMLAQRLGLRIGIDSDLPVYHDHPASLRGFIRQQTQYGRGAQQLRRTQNEGGVEFSKATVAKILARTTLHHPEHMPWLVLSQLAVTYGRFCEWMSPQPRSKAVR